MGGRVRQIAYAAADVASAAAAFAASTGAGPFFLRHHPPLPCWDPASGAGGELRHTSAHGQWGDVQVELLRIDLPVGFGPAAPAVHHMAFFAGSIEDDIARLAARGWPLLLRAESVTGMPFAFVDARDDLGHLVELYEPVPGLVTFYDAVRRASMGWDGTDPVRPMNALGPPPAADAGPASEPPLPSDRPGEIDTSTGPGEADG